MGAQISTDPEDASSRFQFTSDDSSVETWGNDSAKRAMTSFCEAVAALPSHAMASGVTEACKLLGRGNYSEVWHCRVNVQPEQVAVKVITSKCGTPSNAKEVDLLKDLTHPNLVQFIDVVERCPRLLILEVCLGGNVYQFLHGIPGQALSMFSIEQRVKPASEVAFAVAYLHSRDVIHRDIKAGNVFFADIVSGSASSLPTAKLGDVELARHRGEKEIMTPCVGTVLYMAPEQAASNDYGKPADVFAVAVFSNELATGERPYSERFRLKGARDMVRVTLSVQQGVRPRLCDDERLREAFETCWNQEPAARWHASELGPYLHSIAL